MSSWLGDLFSIIVFVLVVAVAYVSARVLYSYLYHKLEKTLGRGTAHLIGKSSQYGLIAIAVGMAFYYILDLNLTPLIASLGIISIAVAFACQQLAQNAMAGVLVSTIKPFEIEDYIELGGTPTTEWAKVREISLTHTTMRDKEGRLFNIPNSFFMSNKIINYTKSGVFKLKIDIHLEPSTVPPMAVLEALVLQETAEDARVMPNITVEEKTLALERLELNMRSLFEKQLTVGDFLPKVELLDIQGDNLTVGIRLWIRDVTKSASITTDLLERLRIRFSKEGIHFAND
ncbi:MAG: mechanosensitive ion channel domain-containing protein [Methanomassiliicoccales archaeon]